MKPIGDYLLIGDLHSAALVSSGGSIDWFCVPTFDSPSIFGAILDDEHGGTFAIDAPGYESSSHYVPDTAIAETTFTNEEGMFTVRDFLLPRPTEEAVPHFLVRKIRAEKGPCTVHMICDPRPRYGVQRVRMTSYKPRIFRARLGERSLWLHVPKGAEVHKGKQGYGLEITMHLQEGEEAALILEYSVETRLNFQWRDLEGETIAFWKEWVAQGTFYEWCRDALVRSAITLKLMQFYPTGGIIAAPTTSLPETPQGERNWDYRFVWLRDATFVLYAFRILGYKEEAKKFFLFMEEVAEEISVCEGDHCPADVAVMYTIWGQKVESETILSHLKGYDGAQPVRIGNGAGMQRQLDIYGSVIDAYFFMHDRGVQITKKGREVILLMARKIRDHWQETESGMWEVRNGTQHFTYGKVMAWVGIDRIVQMSETLGFSAQQLAGWETLRTEIHDWIWANCYDEEQGTFVQHPNTKEPDATNLLFLLLRFIDRSDPRAQKIVDSTLEQLRRDDLYVYRYHTEDGLTGKEGGFLLCSYWMVSALANLGQGKEAKRLFEALHAHMPAHGLMAEEVDTETGEFLGNYPQAFSHIGHVMSAHYLERIRRKEEG